MNDISKLKDNQLLEKFETLVKEEREAVSEVILHLSEIDRRKLYAKVGYSSLFSYCVEKYHYSEQATYRRIQAARLIQKFPKVLEFLKKGDMNLTTLVLISPYLSQENEDFILKSVQKKSKIEVEKFLASLFPKEEEMTEDKIRRLPLPQRSLETAQNLTIARDSILPLISSDTEEAQKPLVFQKERPVERIAPIASRKVKIEFCASEELAKKIQRAKELLRHKYPKGKLEDILDEALELLLEKKDPERKIKKNETSPVMSRSSYDTDMKTRYIPIKTKQTAWDRDKGQCSYISFEGKQCRERNFLVTLQNP